MPPFWAGGFKLLAPSPLELDLGPLLALFPHLALFYSSGFYSGNEFLGGFTGFYGID